MRLKTQNEISDFSAQFLSGIRNAYYKSSGNNGERLNLQKLYSGYSKVFSPLTLKTLLHQVSTDENENRRLKYLTEFISVECINYSMVHLKQQLFELKSQMFDLRDGNRLSYYGIKQRLFWGEGNEKAELDNILKQFTENEINSLLLEIFQSETEAINELGYIDHAEMFYMLTRIDPIVWRNSAEKFLTDTSEGYFRNLYDLKNRHFGGKNRDLSRDELFKFLWEQSEHNCFKSIDPLDLFNMLKKRTGTVLNSESIKLANSDNSSRSFCSVLHVPDDIRLVIGKGRGFHQIRDLMHELGHALHYATVDENLPFEFSMLGDESVTESYAALLENLVYDPCWLESEIHIDKIQKSELISYLKFYKLTKLRSIALKAIYDIDLYSGISGEDLKSNYILYHRQHLGVDVKEYEYLSETEPFLFSIRYFRAQILASSIRRKLETSFGSKWFENTEAFKELSGLWRSGQKYSPEEISETFCSTKLNELDLSSDFI